MTRFEKCWVIYKGKFSARAEHFPVKIPQHFSNLVILHTYLLMNMEPIQYSERSAYKTRTPGNYREERIQHSEQGESLKSTISILLNKQSLN